MRSTVCLVAVCVTTIHASSAAISAQDAAKGTTLLAEARRALGGEEKLRAVRALDVRGDFRRAAGQVTVAGELQVRLEVSGKLRRDEDLSLPGGAPAVVRTQVLNGTTVWDEASGGGGAFTGRFGRGYRGGRGREGVSRVSIDPARLEEVQRATRQAELSRLMLAWLLTTNGDVSWIATAESPDGKADVVEVTPATGLPTRVFLDQTTHMPLMITWQGAAPQLIAGRGASARGDAISQPPQRAPQATLRMTLADYKTVDGVKLPHLITRGVNDVTIEEWTIESYRINPSFKAEVFSK